MELTASDEPPKGRPRRELWRGTAELAVLSVLARRPRYGYELMQVLADTGDGALEIAEGTMYPLLHRLEDAGLISSSWQTGERARPRKYYDLTTAGRVHTAALRDEWTRITTALRLVTEHDEEAAS